jgi:hypothetical protein
MYLSMRFMVQYSPKLRITAGLLNAVMMNVIKRGYGDARNQKHC